MASRKKGNGKREGRAEYLAHLDEQAKVAREQAIECLESAISTMKDPMGDTDAVVKDVGDALVFIGESRGLENAAVDANELDFEP